MIKSVFAVLITLFVFSSCNKYPDGPSISLISKKSRLCNDWVLVSKLRNAEDVTDDNVTSKLVIEKDGTYSWSETYEAMGQFKGNFSSGDWEFGDSKTTLNLFEKKGDSKATIPTRTLKINELRNKQIKLIEKFPSLDLEITYIYTAK